MSKQFKQLVKNTLGEKLKEQYPAVSECKLKLSRGDVAFMVPTTSPSISGYIVLVRDHHGRDQFAIEVGWSTKGQFPTLPGRPSGKPTVERAEFQKGEFICRLSKIWSKADPWWGDADPGGSRNPFLTLEDETKFRQNDHDWQNRAIKHATDAVEQIKKHGIPYLDEFFASKNVSRV